MARQARSSTHPLTPQKWSTKFTKYALEANELAQMGLIGDGDEYAIKVHKDLEIPVGQTIRVPMSGPLTGVGGGDNFNSEDIMETYETFYQDVEIHERGIVTGNTGPMAIQNMLEDWNDAATKKVGDRKGVIMELELIKALSGLYNLSTDVQSVNEFAPTSGRIAYGGETAAGVIDPLSALGDGTALGAYTSGTKFTTDALLSADTVSECLMGPNFIEKCVINFMNSEPRPGLLNIEGRKCLLLLMTPYQALALQHNATYKERNLYAEVRGSKNPLLRDSYGFWNCGDTSVLLKSYGRIEHRTGAGGTTPSEGFTLNAGRTATTDAVASGVSVGRALLLGAGAGCIAYGKTQNAQLFDRIKGDLDKGTGRKPFIGVDWVYGVSKGQYKDEAGSTQEDYAVMCLDTCEQH